MRGVALFVLATSLVGSVQAQWSNDDMSLFDLVEEVNGTFYELFNIAQDAPLAAVKKAYKRLALAHHPDKSSDPNAPEIFRQVAAVYEVLKDGEARERYDLILRDGLPDWRQPVFYYRNLRKMPWWESLLLVLAILTAGHYLCLWGAYIDRRLTASQAVEAQVKREQKKLKRREKGDLDELVEERLAAHSNYLNRPRLSQLLPFKILRGILGLALATPSLCVAIFRALRRKEEAGTEVVVEETDEERRARRGVVFTPDIEYEMAADLKPVSTFAQPSPEEEEAGTKSSKAKGSEWAVEEVGLLIRLSTAKFPLGTPNRWEKIAEALGRSVADITTMIGKVKKMERSEYERLSKAEGQQLIKASDAAATLPEATQREAAGKEEATTVVEWSQSEQKALEAALARFPKETPERWERIAEAVPGRSKEDCLARFRHLAQILRQRKAQAKQ